MFSPDEVFMQQTLKLAKKGLSWTNPNPMVGAVIVKNGTIIGQGYHHQAGLAHAEIEAIKSVKKDLKGATIYVNLEPCTHFGKTPPCVDAIVKSGIKKVVCATLDPNPKVSGKGVEKLREAGAEVIVGILEKQALFLNEAFFTYQIHKRPFIALKFASSLDGKTATKTGDSKWITNEGARKFARKLRTEYQAILVGINTVLKDDPNLGARDKGKKDPIRIILDSFLKIPLTAEVFRDEKVIIATTVKADQAKLKQLQGKHIQVIILKGEQVPLKELMNELYKREIISILVEGGSTVLDSFIKEGLADKTYAFFAPIIIGGVPLIKDALKFKGASLKQFNDNFLFIGGRDNILK